MQRFSLFYTQEWYVGLHVWQKELVRTSLELYAREERMKSGFADYSFLVFPMAKAYEGFLKQYLLDLGFITQEVYMDKRFRIGRSLNPDINPSHRDDQWVYGKIQQLCGESLGRELWNTWLECRNQVFHYFPDNQKKLSLAQSGQCLEMMANAMEHAVACQLSAQR